jgi:predicted nucleic acid-binding protein
MKAFFDTNVLVYAFLDVEKRKAALDVLAEGGATGVQALNEFVNLARRKRNRSWSEIGAALALIRDHLSSIAPITVETHEAAITLARDHQLSFYDALVVAAARQTGCDVLFSEDLQHGLTFGSLKVVNPFA